jgi:hypothetical protein
MTKTEILKFQKKFLKKAERKGFKVEKNNVKKAKTLDSVCGTISTKKPISFQELLTC